MHHCDNVPNAFEQICAVAYHIHMNKNYVGFATAVVEGLIYFIILVIFALSSV